MSTDIVLPFSSLHVVTLKMKYLNLGFFLFRQEIVTMNLKYKVGLCREKNNQTSKHVGNNDA